LARVLRTESEWLWGSSPGCKVQQAEQRSHNHFVYAIVSDGDLMEGVLLRPHHSRAILNLAN
jgi:transketolase